MATDIMDKDLKNLRNQRWDKAFTPNLDGSTKKESPKLATNRKATIVIEHLIQASDVAHTMQHWHIYRKWNERLFKEMYLAYLNGRSDTDPSVGWYKGEIGFLDFYVIPLAKKLATCGVFGVSSDEYLLYAERNRAVSKVSSPAATHSFSFSHPESSLSCTGMGGQRAASSGRNAGKYSTKLRSPKALEKVAILKHSKHKPTLRVLQAASNSTHMCVKDRCISVIRRYIGMVVPPTCCLGSRRHMRKAIRHRMNIEALYTVLSAIHVLL